MDGSSNSRRFKNFLIKELGKMKRTTLLTTILMLSAFMTLTSCQNEGWNFTDYEYQAVYFAYQYPVRTIVLGESKFNNELDNEHQFRIMATTSGVYENKNHVMVDFEIDETLVDGFRFDSESGDQIQAMPGNYFEIVDGENKLTIPEGELAGGVTIQLTDAFFDDPGAIEKTYVLPVKMTSVANADTILSGSGKEVVDNPRRGVASDWDVQPKDYTFYAVKYINPWDGMYLRRGQDVITYSNGDTETITRHEDFIVDDQVVELNTQSLSETAFPVTYSNSQGQNIPVTLILTTDEQGNVTISDNASDYTATGSGTFVHKSESEESWGEENRNAIYLDYEIDWDQSQRHIETADTLVLRDRGVAMETFTPVLQ